MLTGALLSLRASVVVFHNKSLQVVNKEVRPLVAGILPPQFRLKGVTLFQLAGLSGLHLWFKSIILSLLASLVIPEGRNRVTVGAQTSIVFTPTDWATQDLRT